MARGTSGRLHFIDSNNRKVSGFTLLELLIAIAVITVLATAAAPSFSSLIESNKVKRLATEIEWLLVQAKSEAVMRSEKVIVTSSGIAINSASSSASWSIIASLSSGSTVLAMVDGEQFPNIKIYRTFSSTEVTFDHLTGRPNLNGSYVFSSSQNVEVKVRTSNMTGRLYVCSQGGEYGYGLCP